MQTLPHATLEVDQFLGEGEIGPAPKRGQLAEGKENANHRTGQAAGTDGCKAGKGSKANGKQPAGKTGEIMDKAEGMTSATAQSTWKGPAAAAGNPAEGDERNTLHGDDMSARVALEDGAGAAETHSPSIKPEKRFACEEEAPATCQGDGPAAKRLKLDTNTADDRNSMPEDKALLVRCTRCQCEVPRNKSQVDSIWKESFKCNVCNSNMVRLNRAFGQWPIKDFIGLDAEEKRLFYLEIKAMKGRALQTFVQEKFSLGMTEQSSKYGFDYCEGNDTNDIIEKCRDTYQHPFLGKHNTKVAEVKRAKRALERIAPAFDVLHALLGPEGVQAYNGLRQVQTCAEKTIASKGAVEFPYRAKGIFRRLKAAVQANDELERLKRFTESKKVSPR